MATFKDCLFDGGIRDRVFVDRTNNQQYNVLDFHSAVVSRFDNHFRHGKKVEWRDVKGVVYSLEDVCVE